MGSQMATVVGALVGHPQARSVALCSSIRLPVSRSLSVRLSVRRPVSHSVCTCLAVHVSIPHSVSFCNCLSVRQFVGLPHPTVSICLCVCHSVCLSQPATYSVCLSVYLNLSVSHSARRSAGLSLRLFLLVRKLSMADSAYAAHMVDSACTLVQLYGIAGCTWYILHLFQTYSTSKAVQQLRVQCQVIWTEEHTLLVVRDCSDLVGLVSISCARHMLIQ